MSLNIAGFIKSLLPSLSRSDLETDLGISMDSIDTVVSTYENLKEVQKVSKFNSKVVNKLLDEFYQEYQKSKPHLKLGNGQHLGDDIVTLFNNVRLNGVTIRKEVEDLANEVIVTQAMTAYKSNIVRAVGHYYFLTRFALDLANFVYLEEMIYAKADLPSDAKLNKKQIAFIQNNVWIFARLLSVYGSEQKHFQDQLEKLGEISIPKEEVEEAVASYSQDKVDLFNNLPNNFVGSPIYTIRLVFAEWEANRYKQLKDKKKLLELRFLHLRMLKEQGQSDANMEKELVHLQRRITDIDYTVSKMEASVE